MCGRFALVDDMPRLLTRFLFRKVSEGLRLSAPNGSPTQTVLTIRETEEGRLGSSMRWGLVPFWGKDLSIGIKMIHARSETVATKPPFRTALKQRRCLVPASGFYEWARDVGKRQPHFFRRLHREPFAMAGIWDLGPVDLFGGSTPAGRRWGTKVSISWSRYGHMRHARPRSDWPYAVWLSRAMKRRLLSPSIHM